MDGASNLQTPDGGVRPQTLEHVLYSVSMCWRLLWYKMQVLMTSYLSVGGVMGLCGIKHFINIQWGKNVIHWGVLIGVGKICGWLFCVKLLIRWWWRWWWWCWQFPNRSTIELLPGLGDHTVIHMATSGDQLVYVVASLPLVGGVDPILRATATRMFVFIRKMGLHLVLAPRLLMSTGFWKLYINLWDFLRGLLSDPVTILNISYCINKYWTVLREWNLANLWLWNPAVAFLVQGLSAQVLLHLLRQM